MSKRLLFFILVLSVFKPIPSFCATSSNVVTKQTILQKINANTAFKMQHRLAKVENFMAKHKRGLADNAGAQVLIYLLVAVLTLFLVFWLGSKINAAVFGPIALILLGVFLLYALYRYGTGKKTLFKSY